MGRGAETRADGPSRLPRKRKQPRDLKRVRNLIRHVSFGIRCHGNLHAFSPKGGGCVSPGGCCWVEDHLRWHRYRYSRLSCANRARAIVCCGYGCYSVLDVPPVRLYSHCPHCHFAIFIVIIYLSNVLLATGLSLTGISCGLYGLVSTVDPLIVWVSCTTYACASMHHAFYVSDGN